ncbi:nicotinamide riboside transporter PnuC [Mucilaginibacter pedocola]|uniref:Nicotinamide riboside transporter PnuC n=1 Tax=Mucilaginibacter pedocola TaxID=1792845 RepID=A0A1S9P9E6_9SPHI|nr:nicotinamide riboside transporter PnuC [Mucilaginibacter pedocola]OOQ57603.1 nicotinamide mononucleotide transporter [Mucilaginibacter pedocola]
MHILSLSVGQHLIQEIRNTSLLEWVGAVTGAACVYLAARQSIWNWWVAIISVLAYAIVFYENQLYGDALLQMYFLSTSVYGWYFWLKKTEKDEKPITSLNNKELILTAVATATLALVLGLVLDKFTPTNVPYVDGCCTAISFIAQLLMTRKVLQNWALWVFVDACYVPLYIYKSLYLTALLYVILLIIAYKGYIDWNKQYKAATLAK